MAPFNIEFQAIWADLDPNGHMRHSAYNNYAAQARIGMFETEEVDLRYFEELNIGPVLFREETRFYREIKLGEHFTVDIRLLAARQDGSKWSFQHDIKKQGDELAASIVVDGAWLDLLRRKIITPPSKISEMIHKIARHENFEVIPPRENSHG